MHTTNLAPQLQNTRVTAWSKWPGTTCFFAYLYIRPLIRRRLGSASRFEDCQLCTATCGWGIGSTTTRIIWALCCRGYINFYSVYIGWLCSAVFLHLPSLEALGIDIRTDVSVLLTMFAVSVLVCSYNKLVPYLAQSCWGAGSFQLAGEACTVHEGCGRAFSLKISCVKIS